MDNETWFRTFLLDKGFTVNKKAESTNGLDIVAIKRGHYFLIETTSVLNDAGNPRVRIDKCKDEADFIIAVSNNRYFFPIAIGNKPMSKIVLFYELIYGSG